MVVPSSFWSKTTDQEEVQDSSRKSTESHDYLRLEEMLVLRINITCICRLIKSKKKKKFSPLIIPKSNYVLPHTRSGFINQE